MFWYRNYWREYGMQKSGIFWINENSLVDTNSLGGCRIPN